MTYATRLLAVLAVSFGCMSSMAGPLEDDPRVKSAYAAYHGCIVKEVADLLRTGPKAPSDRARVGTAELLCMHLRQPVLDLWAEHGIRQEPGLSPSELLTEHTIAKIVRELSQARERLAAKNLAKVAESSVSTPAARKSSDAVPISLYGIEIGRSLSPPECEIERTGATSSRPMLMAYSMLIKEGPCYQRRKPSDTYLFNEDVTIKWPPGKGPAMSKTGEVYVTLREAIAERITVPTAGLASQETDYLALLDKFGQPFNGRQIEVSNRAGATVKSREVIWRVGEISVMFFGSNDQLDSGSVIVETPRGRALNEESMNKLTEGRPKL